jgi:hypothetical protein
MSFTLHHQAESQYKFIFSNLLPTPKLSFQYSNAQAAAFIQESTTQHIHCTLHSATNQKIQLDLIKGVLTLDYCDQLLKDLMKCPEMHAFRQKVNPEHQVEYYKIIKHPMDLRTLQERLCSGQVTTVSQFKRELDLIWNNCVDFNGPTHPLSVIAAEAQRNIDQVWENSSQPAPSHALDRLRDLESLLDVLHTDMSSRIRIDARPMIPPPKRIPRPVPKPAAVEAAPPRVVDVVPNHQQRKLIADKLSRASVQEMRPAWDLLKPFIDHEAQKAQSLSLNALPDPVLIELRKLVLA